MKKLFVVSIAALSLLACGKGKSNNPFKAVAQAAGDKDLQHTFSTDCVLTPGEAASTAVGAAVGAITGTGSKVSMAQTTQYAFEGDSVTRTVQYFSDNNCKSGKLYQTQIIGEYKRETDASKNSNDGGRQIEMKWNVAYVTATPEGIAVLNNKKFCGKADYTEKSVEVTAQAKDCLSTELPAVQKNIYRVDDKNLTLGNDNVKTNSTFEQKLSSPIYHRI